MNIYETITDQIIKAIERGVDEWKMPWHGKSSIPRNPITGSNYNGSNVLMLWATCDRYEYPDSLWASYKQWALLGAQVNKGEKGTGIIFYQKREKQDEADEKPDFIAKAYSVFNVSQTKGYQDQLPIKPVASVLSIDRHISRTGARILHGGSRACYVPSADEIRMPSKESFIGTKTSTPTDSYYGVLLHELTHWSGAKSRLDRDLTSRFGTEGYAMEELVAELGSAFLCAEHNLSTSPREDHAIYVRNWLKVLKNDPKAIFHASSKAKQAVEYLLRK